MKPLDKVPAHVAQAEAAELFKFMAFKKITTTQFTYKKSHIIFESLKYLISEQGFTVGAGELEQYLTTAGLLEEAGGHAYIQKIFEGFEPADAV